MSNREKPEQQISIRIPLQMYQEIQRTAKIERRSMNAQIIKIIEEVVSVKEPARG